jgi:hypothetical protein
MYVLSLCGRARASLKIAASAGDHGRVFNAPPETRARLVSAARRLAPACRIAARS